jgi:hypothetical protein
LTKFSERKGLKPVRAVVQKDDVDNALRNGLWNGLQVNYWSGFEGTNGIFLSDYSDLEILMHRLWHFYFKAPIDTLPSTWEEALAEVRKYYFGCKWYEVYDFLEFIVSNYSKGSVNGKFMEFCNGVLQREMSSYRFVSGQITEITSEQEIEAVENATTHALKAASEHLSRALSLLSDRKSPDYRNSIKESISAVEATCRLIVGHPKANLGQAIAKVKEKVPIHPALEGAFDKLYGYTSDEEGIRHSLLDKTALNFEDAKFMLVSCATFVNYLLAKTERAGIKLSPPARIT